MLRDLTLPPRSVGFALTDSCTFQRLIRATITKAKVTHTGSNGEINEVCSLTIGHFSVENFHALE